MKTGTNLKLPGILSSIRWFEVIGMKSALLIGNGLNRCCEHSLSWEELLCFIAKGNLLPIPAQNAPNAALRYDQIANMILNQIKDKTFLKTMDRLTTWLDKVQPILIHYQAVNLPINLILTTNYDYVLERAFLLNTQEKTESGWKVILNQETIRSAKRHNRIGNKVIYHIHGERNYPKSICLGHIHYAENLSRIMDLMNAKKTEEEYILNDIIFTSDSIETWAQCFFTHDIYILGLSLQSADIDLWWLISYRASLLSNERYCNKIKNKIVYYDIYRDSDEEGRTQYREYLNAMRMNVHPVYLEEGKWIDAYAKCIQHIQDQVE